MFAFCISWWLLIKLWNTPLSSYLVLQTFVSKQHASDAEKSVTLARMEHTGTAWILQRMRNTPTKQKLQDGGLNAASLTPQHRSTWPTCSLLINLLYPKAVAAVQVIFKKEEKQQKPNTPNPSSKQKRQTKMYQHQVCSHNPCSCML